MKLVTQTEKYLFVKANAGHPTGKSPIPDSVGVEFLLTMYIGCVGLL